VLIEEAEGSLQRAGAEAGKKIAGHCPELLKTKQNGNRWGRPMFSSGLNRLDDGYC